MKNVLGRIRRTGSRVVESPDPPKAFKEEAQRQVIEFKTAPVEAGDRWVGYIDHVERSLITGWGFDRENPDRPVAVEAVASNGKSKRTIAALFRQDVADAGYGHGKVGFELDVTSLGLKYETLVVRFAESKVAISTAPFFLDPQRSLLEGTLPSAYTAAMQMLALEARARHAELEESGFVRQNP